MFKKVWIALIAFLMYGGCVVLVLDLFFQWGRIIMLITIGVILLSFLLSYWKLRCPHCKKMALPTKNMFVGIKLGRCTCENCGEDIRIK